MPNKTEYRAFTVTYEEIINELTSPASVLPASLTKGQTDFVPVKVTALWDTGAVGTCIKPWLKDQLGLKLFSTQTLLSGVGGNITVYASLINIQLAYNIEIEDCLVYITDFPGNADILIGMDVINMGDFVICDADNKTSFSFAIPSLPDRVNLVDKVEIINKTTSQQ
jgi:hypothetical protein